MEIRQANRRERKLMKKLYLRAFPKAERKPFSAMCRMAAKGMMEMLVIADQGYLVGLAITARKMPMRLRWKRRWMNGSSFQNFIRT